jgi:hypothetical protein
MESTRECSVEECARARFCRGWCVNHYALWRRNGTPDKVQTRTSDADRFWPKVAKGAGCWNWTGGVVSTGYGLFKGYAMATNLAHRWSYFLEHGHIDDELTIDHLCRNRLCVRPDHLELVTSAENLRRAARYDVHGTCKWGHAVTPDNIRINKTGDRQCVTCYQARNKRPRRSLQEIFDHGSRDF